MPPLNLYARVRFSLCILHTRPRVQRAPGLPCALFVSEGESSGKARAYQAARMRNHILALVESHGPDISHVIARSDSDEAIHASAHVEGWIASLRSQ